MQHESKIYLVFQSFPPYPSKQNWIAKRRNFPKYFEKAIGFLLTNNFFKQTYEKIIGFLLPE